MSRERTGRIDESLLRRAVALPPLPMPPFRGTDAEAAAVLVPLRVGGGPARVIMHVRSDAMREHAGEIAFPGGRSEPGDADLRATAEREAEEELALPRSSLEHLGPLVAVPVVTGRYVLHPFAALTTSEPVASTDEIGLVLEIALEPYLSGDLPIGATLESYRGFDFPMPFFPVGDRTLYGASAVIFFDLVYRVAAALGQPLPPFAMTSERPWGERYAG